MMRLRPFTLSPLCRGRWPPSATDATIPYRLAPDPANLSLHRRSGPSMDRPFTVPVSDNTAELKSSAGALKGQWIGAADLYPPRRFALAVEASTTARGLSFRATLAAHGRAQPE